MAARHDTIMTRLSALSSLIENGEPDTRMLLKQPTPPPAPRSMPPISERPPMPPGWGEQPQLHVVHNPPPYAQQPPPQAQRPKFINPDRAATSIAPIPTGRLAQSVVERMPMAPGAPHQQPPMSHAHPKGKVIVVFGCRGGAGATTIAVNTAAELARRGKSTCLVDLDLQLGDVFVALDLEPNTSLAGLAREASTIDRSALVRRLARHASGLYALTQVGAPADVDPELAERTPALISTLCDHFECVVIDGVRDFNDISLAALDMADEIVMVLSQDVPAVRRAARSVTLFRQLGYSDSKVKLVVNRQSRKAAVSNEAIAHALGMPIAATIRRDDRRVADSLDGGALVSQIAPTSAVARDLCNVANLVGGGASLDAPRSLFGFMRRKAGS